MTPARKRVTISPLRYPGGKGLLYSRLRTIIRENGLTSSVYVEPYAGGVGAGLGLLATGQVERVVINDLDPAIYAFWATIQSEPGWLIEQIHKTKLDVNEWRKQREIYQSADIDRQAELGFATFYLNRTNRSGVLNGGPIGGLDQSGNYKIDARFNRDGLSERIRLIALHADRIEVTNEDGLDVISRYADRSDAFIYADPPYFEKAGSLYRHAFEEADHEALAKCLKGVRRSNWILTYDNVPQVAALYSELRRRLFLLNYSAHRVMKATEVMVFSPGLLIPEELEAAHVELAQRMNDTTEGGS
jgi:DNA adenine methylase